MFNRLKVYSSRQYPVYVRKPWIDPVSQIYADEISFSIKRCFNTVLVRCICSTRRALPSRRKDAMPIHQQCLAFYQYKYPYEIEYLGKTIMRLEVTIAYHVPGQISRHEPVTSWCLQTHDFDIGNHIVNSVASRTNYSPEFTVLTFSSLWLLIYNVMPCAGK